MQRVIRVYSLLSPYYMKCEGLGPERRGLTKSIFLLFEDGSETQSESLGAREEVHHVSFIMYPLSSIKPVVPPVIVVKLFSWVNISICDKYVKRLNVVAMLCIQDPPMHIGVVMMIVHGSIS